MEMMHKLRASEALVSDSSERDLSEPEPKTKSFSDKTGSNEENVEDISAEKKSKEAQSEKSKQKP